MSNYTPQTQKKTFFEYKSKNLGMKAHLFFEALYFFYWGCQNFIIKSAFLSWSVLKNLLYVTSAKLLARRVRTTQRSRPIQNSRFSLSKNAHFSLIPLLVLVQECTTWHSESSWRCCSFSCSLPARASTLKKSQMQVHCAIFFWQEFCWLEVTSWKNSNT